MDSPQREPLGSGTVATPRVAPFRRVLVTSSLGEGVERGGGAAVACVDTACGLSISSEEDRAETQERWTAVWAIAV
jgi:hypothetical protein